MEKVEAGSSSPEALSVSYRELVSLLAKALTPFREARLAVVRELESESTKGSSGVGCWLPVFRSG